MSFQLPTLLLLSFLLLLTLCLIPTIDGKNYKPEQIILSLTGKNNKSHVVTYTTGSSVSKDSSYKAAPRSSLYYGLDKNALDQHIEGESKHFEYHNYSADIHVIEFGTLPRSSIIYYRVGDPTQVDGLSQIYSFSTDEIKTYGIYGDFGLESSDKSYSTLIDHLHADEFQSIFHLGDLAYNLDDEDGKVGDNFMNKIQPMSSTIPYMVIPGNHEKKHNFTHYKHRFRGQKVIGDHSNSGTQFYYSFNQPHAHFIFFDTEVYLPDGNEEQQKAQLKWLEADLILYNSPENRKLYPWIITFAHKCDWHEDVEYAKFRTLLHNYGVDIHFCGHQHNYQRLYPGHAFSPFETHQSVNQYINPNSYTQIVIGSPGCSSGLGSHTAPYPNCLAEHLFTYGFGMFRILNSTHFLFNFIETTKGHNKIVADNDDMYTQAHIAMEQNENEFELLLLQQKQLLWKEKHIQLHSPLSPKLQESIRDHLELIQVKHGVRKPLQNNNIQSHYEQVYYYNNYISSQDKNHISLMNTLSAMYKQNQQLLLNFYRQGTTTTLNSIQYPTIEHVIQPLESIIKTQSSLLELFYNDDLLLFTPINDNDEEFNQIQLQSEDIDKIQFIPSHLPMEIDEWVYYDENGNEIQYSIKKVIKQRSNNEDDSSRD